MIRLIAARELKSLFLSPLAWGMLAITQFLFAYLFLAQLDIYRAMQGQLAALAAAPGVTELVVAPLFGNCTLMFLLVAPLVTMRLLAEERKHDTLALLTAAPVSATQIALGKFFGAWVFFVILIILLALMALSLYAGSRLDAGQLAAGILAMLLLAGLFCAIGLFMSSLTAQPLLAAAATFGALLLLLIMDWSQYAGGTEQASAVASYLAINQHFQPLLAGIFSAVDVAYFLIFTALFIALTVWRLDADRMTG